MFNNINFDWSVDKNELDKSTLLKTKMRQVKKEITYDLQILEYNNIKKKQKDSYKYRTTYNAKILYNIKLKIYGLKYNYIINIIVDKEFNIFENIIDPDGETISIKIYKKNENEKDIIFEIEPQTDLHLYYDEVIKNDNDENIYYKIDIITSLLQYISKILEKTDINFKTNIETQNNINDLLYYLINDIIIFSDDIYEKEYIDFNINHMLSNFKIIKQD